MPVAPNNAQHALLRTRSPRTISYKSSLNKAKHGCRSETVGMRNLVKVCCSRNGHAQASVLSELLSLINFDDWEYCQ